MSIVLQREVGGWRGGITDVPGAARAPVRRSTLMNFPKRSTHTALFHQDLMIKFLKSKYTLMNQNTYEINGLVFALCG